MAKSSESTKNQKASKKSSNIIMPLAVGALFGALGMTLITNSGNSVQNNSVVAEEPIVVAQADPAQGDATLAEEETNTIVDVAIANEFETLVAAVQAADLVETLSGEGPFTVFAPTDEAFAALPEGVLDDLLEEENKQQLTDILTYHVVAGDLRAADVVAASGTNVNTVLGEEWHVLVEGDEVFILNPVTAEKIARVLQTDVIADNGVVHVIDTVLIP